MTRLLLLLAACGRVGFDPAPAIDDAGVAPLVAYTFDDPPANGRVACTVPALDAFCNGPVCPTPTIGHRGGGYHFSGTQGLYVPSATLAGVGPAPFTVALWFRQDAVALGTLLGKPLDGTGFADAFALFTDATGTIAIETVATDGTRRYENASFDVVDTAWHHVAATSDGALMQLFIDGATVATAQIAGAQDSLSPLYIGTDLDADDLHAGFAGVLDEVRFFSRALGADEIAALAAP